MTEITYSYFEIDEAIAIHKFIIMNTGENGRPGGMMPIVVDRGPLESVLHQIRYEIHYPDFSDKVTHLVFGINKNHPFGDGNKRASIAFSSRFLQLNGHDEIIAQYTRGMEEVVIWVAKSLLEKEQLKEIIEFLLYEDAMHVAYFIAEAKKYRQYIEPENAPIHAPLLRQMVVEWLSGDMELSEATKVALLEVIAPSEFESES